MIETVALLTVVRIVRHLPGAGAATVFVFEEVAHLMQAILDTPVLADHGRQLLDRDAVGGLRGHGAGHRNRGVAGADGVPLKTNSRPARASMLGSEKEDEFLRASVHES